MINFQTLSDAEIFAIANPLMDHLMAASTRCDYSAHIRDFSDRLLDQLSESQFHNICQEYQSTKGHFENRKSVAVIKRPDAAVIIWTQTFTEVDGEFAAEMLLIHHERYLVDHVMVF